MLEHHRDAELVELLLPDLCPANTAVGCAATADIDVGVHVGLNTALHVAAEHAGADGCPYEAEILHPLDGVGTLFAEHAHDFGLAAVFARAHFGFVPGVDVVFDAVALLDDVASAHGAAAAWGHPQAAGVIALLEQNGVRTALGCLDGRGETHTAAYDHDVVLLVPSLGNRSGRCSRLVGQGGAGPQRSERGGSHGGAFHEVPAGYVLPCHDVPFHRSCRHIPVLARFAVILRRNPGSCLRPLSRGRCSTRTHFDDGSSYTSGWPSRPGLCRCGRGGSRRT